MRRKRGLSFGACLLFCAAPATAALVAGEAAAVHERLRADPSYQFAFSNLPAANRPPPQWMQEIAMFIIRAINFIAPVIQVLFWLGVALIAAGAVYIIGREIWLRLRREDAPEEEETPIYRPAPALTRALLEEADRLAAAGRYAEAAHVLLFRSIEDIQRFQPNHVRAAMTSREISHLAILSPPAREAFAQIAAAVERSRFAGRDIGAEVFARCRAAYGVFAELGS